MSNLGVIGFIYWRTHDEEMSTLRHQVVEQSAVLEDVYRRGGKAATIDAIDDTVALADPQTAVALLDGKGRQVTGNLAVRPPWNLRLQEGYRNTLLRLEGQPAPREAGVVLHRLPDGAWLVTGRTAGDGLAIRETLESSLLIALALTVLLGLSCGLILAQYVGRRIGEIVAVADRISGRDLTQRVRLSGAGDAFDRLGQQINAMLDRIASLMDELRMLTDSLAHDLRSPVSRLRAAADAAARANDPEERDQLLGNVMRQADSLMRMLSTVLEISRSEALTGRKQFSWFDPGALGSELSEMYEPVAEEAGAPLRFDRDAKLPSLFGHRQLLAQAISNLIENAIRYGSSGGAIRVAVHRVASKLRIEVADRGPGIPSELRSEARRRFGRLDSSRSDEGAGLGLALVEAIAHLHDGQLLLGDNHPGLVAALELPVSPR
ncbi:MAG TPA: ATP-binding protein [Sphingomicrobium sp.]